MHCNFRLVVNELPEIISKTACCRRCLFSITAAVDQVLNIANDFRSTDVVYL